MRPLARALARALVLPLLLPLLPACAHRGAPPATTAAAADTSRVERSRRRADLLTAEEFGDRSWANLYDVVSALRSNWLHRRGNDTILGDQRDVQVLLDGVALGGTEQLRAQSVVGVAFLQHYDPMAATARWGMGYGKGAIYISTRSAAESRAAQP